MIQPIRGMIILVTLDPTKGAEKKGRRPAVVVTADEINTIPALPLVQVAPITHWNERKARLEFCVELQPDANNRLEMKSVVDCLQTRIIDYRLGNATEQGFVSPEKMEEIDEALRLVFSL